MLKTIFTCILSSVLCGVFPCVIQADTVTPSDDVYADETAPGTNRNSPGVSSGTPYGLFVKGQTGNHRISFAEFTLPNITVSSAVLHMYHVRSFGVGSPGNDWIMQVSGRQDSFDETVVTWTNTAATLRSGSWTNIGSALTMSGGLSGDGQDVNQARVLDMTTFFNNNKGTTVVIRFVNTDNSGTKGGTLEDKEGSRTGDPSKGVYIEYFAAPIPPTADLSACPVTGRAPLVVQFDASASSAFGATITDYGWDFDGDGTIDQHTATPTLAHTYNAAGAFNPKVTVTDSHPLSTTSSAVNVTVDPAPAIIVPVTDMLPTGGPLSGTQDLTSITAGGNTFTSLTGPPDEAHVVVVGSGIGAPSTLVGLDLVTAMLGLPTSGSSTISVYFDRPILADGTDKPEVFVLDWALSTDDFQLNMLTNAYTDAPVSVASVSIQHCNYTPTATIIHPASGSNQPVGGVGINLDALGVASITGVQIPATGNSPGVDPCAIAAVVKPCSIPFADADADNDVDHNDFGFFQRCYTGDGNTGAFDVVNCFCFDRDHDGDVDEFDLTPFTNCHTGTGVPWSPTLNCPS